MNQDTTPTSGAAIQRYKIGYHADEWGQRSSTPSGIPDASGSWVRYADHVNALAAGQATAPPENIRGILARCRDFIDTTKAPAYPAGADLADEIDVLLAAQPAPQPSHVAQAVVQDDLIALRKPTTSAELLWLLKLAHLVISDVDKTLEETFAPAQPAAPQGVAYAALPDEGEPWRGHKFKEVQRGCWRCDCGKTIKEVTSDQSTPASGGNYPVMPKRYTVDDDGEELFTAEKMRAFADATHTLRASRGQAPALTNLNCKSEQKRLATLWGFVPAQAASVQEDAARWRAWAVGMVEACAAPHDVTPPFMAAFEEAIGDSEACFSVEQLNGWVDAARKQGEKQ